MRALVVAWLLALGAVAHASEDDADRAFRAATQKAVTDPAGALVDLEALGAARPVTRWTDNAWEKAAELAEAAGDYARARANLARAIADGTDPQLVRRARATLARLETATGRAGQWDDVAREHDQLRAAITAGGDPHASLRALAALVRAHPAYPRATAVRLAIARTHELEGENDDAIAWLRAAVAEAGDERGRPTHLQLVRVLIRARDLAAARRELALLDEDPRVDAGARAEVRRVLAKAERRAWVRHGVLVVVLALLGLAGVAIRRARLPWRTILRPPVEVIAAVPFALLLGLVALGGNPLVGRAVIEIAIAGVLIAWLSGVVGQARVARGFHLGGAVLLVLCVSYLSIERGVLDLLWETWHGGHALP